MEWRRMMLREGGAQRQERSMVSLGNKECERNRECRHGEWKGVWLERCVEARWGRALFANLGFGIF